MTSYAKAQADPPIGVLCTRCFNEAGYTEALLKGLLGPRVCVVCGRSGEQSKGEIHLVNRSCRP